MADFRVQIHGLRVSSGDRDWPAARAVLLDLSSLGQPARRFSLTPGRAERALVHLTSTPVTLVLGWANATSSTGGARGGAYERLGGHTLSEFTFVGGGALSTGRRRELRLAARRGAVVFAIEYSVQVVNASCVSFLLLAWPNCLCMLCCLLPSRIYRLCCYAMTALGALECAKEGLMQQWGKNEELTVRCGPQCALKGPLQTETHRRKLTPHAHRSTALLSTKLRA